MRTFFFVLLGVLLLSGCKKNPPNPPQKALLVEPARNSECIPVQKTDDGNNLVRFRWLPGNHSESYEIVVTNLISGLVVDREQRTIDLTLPLEEGMPYSWFVISKNSQTNETATSPIWHFYNPGKQTEHVPFPAEIIAPEPGATVFKDIDNEVNLQWTATDLDDDIEGYSIYFSTENPPEALIALLDTDDTSQKVSVVSDVVYYWRIVTVDALGNTSDTGVLDFKVF
ncbi:hypothetical protein RQM65_07260 [Pricia sp. S334]|uniref:Fibronectin type-III domain-containing protein n=1 Tax=Pricia mediterranea TaxID=3076079 RepID=A0ABU3L3Y0_9FLAO|nr:hypothetical protein [Pricia sp. S334]MDT7828455.1 hypothetical protein [Pricia sp. S334]